MLDRLVPSPQLIRLTWRLAKAGDSRAVALLWERKFGKVPQSVTGGGPDSDPVRVLVLDDRLGIKHWKD